jgi:hypothetical protein
MLIFYVTHIVLLFHNLGFEIRPTLVHVLGKSCHLGCFYACDKNLEWHTNNDKFEIQSLKIENVEYIKPWNQ